MRIIAIFLGVLVAAASLCHSEEPSNHKLML